MKEIKNILIAGGGMMGKNIAFVFTKNPAYQVGVYDMKEVDVAAGIRQNTAELVAKGVLDSAELEERLSRVSFTTDKASPLLSQADLVVDVRFLPNPFYIDTLCRHSGLDEDVRSFVIDHPTTKEFMQRYTELLDFLIPHY